MANFNCSACDDLKNTDVALLVNGLGDDECTSLKNDTGLVATDDHNDCTDLNNLNDCLVGNMSAEVEAEAACNWKTFAKRFIENLWTVEKAIICAICGIWENIHAIWEKIEEVISHLNIVSYIGILTLYTDTQVKWTGSSEANQVPAFNQREYQGNLGALQESVLSMTENGTSITVNNVTPTKLLVECTFNSSIRTGQNFACCFIVVTRDGAKVGQTPFITPSTYDQQVQAEPFVLEPGQSAVMRYYFRIGDKNAWFRSQFGGGDMPQCTLEADDPLNPENQRSYFSVRVTSVATQMS